MQTETLPAADPFAIPHAVDVLKNGGLVAFPTDTVYGLAAPVFDAKSIGRLYAVKGRSHTKAIAILLASPDQLAQVAQNPSAAALALARAFWPGPLTLVVPRHPAVPDALSPQPTIGVRVPDHPVALALLSAAGPLAVTSANLSGGENAVTAAEVLAQLDGRVHLIIDGGRTPGGVPSTVVDCTGGKLNILREGPITHHQLKKALDTDYS